MATVKTLRLVSNALQTATRPLCLQSRTATPYITPTNHDRQPTLPFRRTFLTNPLNPAGSELVASRTLRYPAKAIYSVISDVASYSHFIPYCQSSVVTKSSSPAENGKTYPEEAKLVIGFNEGVSEEFWSRVYCIPDRVVEAVSGNAETSLPPEQIEHHSSRPPAGEDRSRNESVLSHLSTKWTLRPYHYKPPPTSAMSKETTHMNHQETSEVDAQEKCEVHLAILYKFANPMYGIMSQAAAPKVAEKMIEAFERRVQAVVEGPSHALKERKGVGKM
ncbi:Coenzyme Q-binding protein coq10, mitochondrial [Extremus antarcticus]|uniref:Coenzyme Q-binding protein coq10, mitochondrial n=1 Tax=Extremus antarcticus TaxID=702011 RepID=A0AAJ0D7V7_9PEZI|nr:Coenzyme Q-binding protein coq10, mitochondrial [Extremus antarcticus]